jgi:hypothetical protein
MISCFGAMHAIATKRGDGLRPELVDLLRQSRVQAELRAKSSFPLGENEEVAMQGSTAVSGNARR